MLRLVVPFFISLWFVSCAPVATREKAIEIAYRYTQVEWVPEPRHVKHGKDERGIPVHTPDTTLLYHGEHGGWWVPGKPAKSMPYKWGGFDTPESFLKGLKAGKKAGDVATRWKKANLEAAVSEEAVGIDCSGFVSRCWQLPKQYSTRDLPKICVPLESWDELKKGDILLKDGHVILFEKWNDRRTEVIGYEASPRPFWRVNACGIPKERLKRERYHPWRYLWMKDG